MASPGTDTAPTAAADPPVAAMVSAEPEPMTLAQSLIAEAGWSAANFGAAGAHPPYLRIGGKLRLTLTDYEPCFSSFHRDRVLFRSKVSMADHLAKFGQIMIDPIAFEECYGPGEGTEATFPFGTWLTIRKVASDGIGLWGKRHGRVLLPLEPLRVASAVWLRGGPAPQPNLGAADIRAGVLDG